MIVDLGTCLTSGARIYDLHNRRELLKDDKEILDTLTGHNRIDKNRTNQPHPTWAEVKRLTATEHRKN